MKESILKKNSPKNIKVILIGFIFLFLVSGVIVLAGDNLRLRNNLCNMKNKIGNNVGDKNEGNYNNKNNVIYHSEKPEKFQVYLVGDGNKLYGTFVKNSQDSEFSGYDDCASNCQEYIGWYIPIIELPTEQFEGSKEKARNVHSLEDKNKSRAVVDDFRKYKGAYGEDYPIKTDIYVAEDIEFDWIQYFNNPIGVYSSDQDYIAYNSNCLRYIDDSKEFIESNPIDCYKIYRINKEDRIITEQVFKYSACEFSSNLDSKVVCKKDDLMGSIYPINVYRDNYLLAYITNDGIMDESVDESNVILLNLETSKYKLFEDVNSLYIYEFIVDERKTSKTSEKEVLVMYKYLTIRDNYCADIIYPETSELTMCYHPNGPLWYEKIQYNTEPLITDLP